MGSLDNAAVAKVLAEIGQMLEVRGDEGYRARAYRTAAERIAHLGVPIEGLVEEKRLTELPGIGPGLAARITELVTTGKSAFHEELRRQAPPGLAVIARLPGMGPKKTQRLHDALGIEDVLGLERALREAKVRTVPGFGAKTEAKLLEAIEKLRGERQSDEPRAPLLSHALRAADELLPFIRDVRGVSRAELAGEARRGCETVSRLVIVAVASDPAGLFDAVVGHPQVGSILRRAERSILVQVIDPAIQLELECVDAAGFVTALFIRTGSNAHLAKVTARAATRGLLLHAHGFEDEAALYAALGMSFVPPELREDLGEVEAALRGERWDDLVELSDIRGVVHSHSTWSDGRATLEEMAQAAEALGYEYLTVTDHSQAASYARGLSEDALRRQGEEIDGLNARLRRLRLLKGTESDILASGALDYPEQTLRGLEVVVGSVHARHQLDEAKMTARILAALDHPALHILGHPTGRLIHRRPPYAVRMDEIVARAALRGVAVEINGSPDRLDLKDTQVRQALHAGAKLVVSADSHSVRELRNLRYAVLVARRGGARKKDVLNTLPAAEFVRR